MIFFKNKQQQQFNIYIFLKFRLDIIKIVHWVSKVRPTSLGLLDRKSQV